MFLKTLGAHHTLGARIKRSSPTMRQKYRTNYAILHDVNGERLHERASQLKRPLHGTL